MRPAKPRRFHLDARDWGWLYFKLSSVVWLGLLLWLTPTSISAALGMIAAVFTTAGICGAVVSSAGLVMASRGGVHLRRGLGVELSGLVVMVIGPVGYFLTQMWLMFDRPDGVAERAALCALAHLLCAAMACRIIIVITRRKRVGAAS